MVGYMSGVTIVFTIPVGLALLDKKDHKYFTIGILSGLLGMPFGVFISCIILSLSSPYVRSDISPSTPLDYKLNLSLQTIGMNIWPLILFTLIIVICLWNFTKITTKSFIIFGWVLNACIKIVFVLCAIEIVTGGTMKYIFKGWGFDPIIADSVDQFRALEVSGVIALVLTGAYPMIHILKTYASKPISKVGEKIGRFLL